MTNAPRSRVIMGVSAVTHVETPAPTTDGFDMPREQWAELFAALAGGDEAALERLYDVAAKPLYGLALWRTRSREDAADVVHQVFVRLAERRDRLGSVRDPRAWLLAVAHRVAVDSTRRRTVRAAIPIDVDLVLEAPAVDGDRRLDARRASALLAVLPAEQREVIYLHHYADCTFAAIGDATGVPTFTAASRYRLGIAKLRRLMGATS